MSAFVVQTSSFWVPFRGLETVNAAKHESDICNARAQLVRRAKGLLGLRVLRLEIGRHRAKSVQQSVDAVARAANGQSERPLERGIGCNSDVPHAPVEDRTRGTVARSHWRPGARSACTPEARPAAACAGPRLAVD